MDGESKSESKTCGERRRKGRAQEGEDNTGREEMRKEGSVEGKEGGGESHGEGRGGTKC